MGKYKITCTMQNGLIISVVFQGKLSEDDDNVVLRGLSAITDRMSEGTFALSQIKDCKVDFIGLAD